MDGETIRLIVVACGAIAAGLGGALIAGAFNSRNTLAAIEAARVAAETQREADREIEHDRWLRDRKLVTYTNFMAQMQEIDLLIQDMHRFPGTDISQLPQIAAKMSSDELMLLAPKKVRSGITAMYLGLRAMIAASEDFPPGEERLKAYEAAADVFIVRHGELTALIREDLGAED